MTDQTYRDCSDCRQSGRGICKFAGNECKASTGNLKFEPKEIKPLPACVRCVHFREESLKCLLEDRTGRAESPLNLDFCEKNAYCAGDHFTPRKRGEMLEVK